MKTFILMTKLSPEMTTKMKDRSKIGRKWLDHVKEKCPDVKFTAHYAILGQFDFLDIYEAPNDETAAMVSLISRSDGAIEAQSLSAIPYKDFLEMTEKL
ncbi:MAG: GYD domain-containing protein [Chlorobi bacterium]|nr:GYD domain-containing protein [Chlorobiota bacterium]